MRIVTETRPFTSYRYEFRQNEFISAVESVSLATSSTISGRKEFIAVGTTVYRGEDLAARGGVSNPLLYFPLNFSKLSFSLFRFTSLKLLKSSLYQKHRIIITNLSFSFLKIQNQLWVTFVI